MKKAGPILVPKGHPFNVLLPSLLVALLLSPILIDPTVPPGAAVWWFYFPSLAVAVLWKHARRAGFVRDTAVLKCCSGTGSVVREGACPGF